jgi:hypothetical protein
MNEERGRERSGRRTPVYVTETSDKAKNTPNFGGATRLRSE